MFETLIQETVDRPITTDAASAPQVDSVSVSRRNPDIIVPIRSLGENHRGRIGGHLKALETPDRYFRFGFAASDDQIQRYVDSLDFDNDEIFGIYNRRLELIAMAHLAYSVDRGVNCSSEFGVSVLAPARGRGYGARLFQRAVMHARNQGVRKMFVHVLSENTAMLAIARSAGATVSRDGAESEAHLTLPPGTLNTQLTEIVEEHMAQANYQFKVQAIQFQEAIARMQSAWVVNGQGSHSR